MDNDQAMAVVSYCFWRIINTMDNISTNNTERYIKYAMIFLIIVLLVLGLFIARDYAYLRRAQLINAQKLQVSALTKNHYPLTVNDLPIISPWMTFHYINKIFNVPPDYLETSLSISDPSYPQMSLSGYAKQQHIDSALLVTQVESSLYEYLTAASSTN